MKQINRIYEALINRKEKVCHKSEIAEIIKEYRQKFKSSIDIVNTIKYLSRHNYIKRIFNSYYYLNSLDERKRNYRSYRDKELLFIVLNKLKIRWYIGLSSALYIEGKMWQVPRVMHIINNKFTGTKRILSLKVSFSKIKESLFFALEKAETKNKAKYSYSSLSKSYLDMVYLKKSDKLTKDKDTKKYLRHYPKWVGKR